MKSRPVLVVDPVVPRAVADALAVAVARDEMRAVPTSPAVLAALAEFAAAADAREVDPVAPRAKVRLL